MIKSETLLVRGILVEPRIETDHETAIREAAILALDYNTPVILESTSGVRHTADPAVILATIRRAVAQPIDDSFSVPLHTNPDWEKPGPMRAGKSA